MLKGACEQAINRVKVAISYLKLSSCYAAFKASASFELVSTAFPADESRLLDCFSQSSSNNPVGIAELVFQHTNSSRNSDTTVSSEEIGTEQNLRIGPVHVIKQNIDAPPRL